MARLKVTTKAFKTRPIAASTVRSRLGLASSEDTLLGQLLDQAMSEMESETGFPLARQSYTEYGGGNGEAWYYLQCRPLDPNSLGTAGALTVDTEALTLGTDYWIESTAESLLYYPLGFPGDGPYNSSGDIQVDADYTAGYVMPESISTWAVATAYAVGDWVRPSSPTLSPLLMECTTAGTSHATTEPTWTAVEDATKTDGTATWTQRNAVELPAWVQTVGFLAAQRGFDRSPTNLKSRRAAEFSETYTDDEMGGALLTQRERAMLRRLARP